MKIRTLLVNPSRWGRGITPIWIASHAGLLRKHGFSVRLFDATFFSDWSKDEIGYNTVNQQYLPTEYSNTISFKSGVKAALQQTIDEYAPHVIMWSAISSHIHGEGEYINFLNGIHLLSDLVFPSNVLRLAGGIIPTADPCTSLSVGQGVVDGILTGDSETSLLQIVTELRDNQHIGSVSGLVRRKDLKSSHDIHISRRRSDLFSEAYAYDYSIFEDQVFIRPYNGRLVRAVDYELSRGCPYTCAYCVETVIQKHYGFESSNKRGVVLNADSYLRCRSAQSIISDLKYFERVLNINLIRCQDTNFMSINRQVLSEVSEYLSKSFSRLYFYIETRPESISSAHVQLLKKLNVDGVGMGIELASESFREEKLNRFCNLDKIRKAFRLLRVAGIKRTSYNIIGLPGQTENDIIETINFNKELDPDNITVAFYSPYIGTSQSDIAVRHNMFEYMSGYVDGQLETAVLDDCVIDRKTLEYYKSNFVSLVRS